MIQKRTCCSDPALTPFWRKGEKMHYKGLSH